MRADAMDAGKRADVGDDAIGRLDSSKMKPGVCGHARDGGGRDQRLPPPITILHAPTHSHLGPRIRGARGVALATFNRIL